MFAHSLENLQLSQWVCT